MRHVRVSRRNGRLILRIEESRVGKNYDAYEQARQAEIDAKARWQLEPSAQTETDARQAEAIANVVFNEFLEDPES